MKYFKIIGETSEDQLMVEQILAAKTFYPESTSVPPLPLSYDENYDYRQFFIVFPGRLSDGFPIVYTRKEYTVEEFNTIVVPADDWTTRYMLSTTPTIEEVENEKINVEYKRTNIVEQFLNYDYQIYNNK